MKIKKNQPAREVEKKVKNVRFVFDQNIAYVELLGEHPEMVKVDLSEINLTDAKLETVQDYLGEIIAEAASVEIKDVPKTEILKKEKLKKEL